MINLRGSPQQLPRSQPDDEVRWRPVVICADCRQRHTCARLVSEPCVISIVCHGCEASLSVDITAGELTIQRCADRQQLVAPFLLIGVPVAPAHGSSRDR